jgi:hypothetical protein
MGINPPPGNAAPFPAGDPPLVVRARSLVAGGQAFDTVHILLAALQFPQDAGQARDVLMRMDPAFKQRLLTAVTTYLEFSAEPATLREARTDRLRMCMDRWQQFSAGSPPTNALVLWVILSYDPVIARLVESAGVNARDVAAPFDGIRLQPDPPAYLAAPAYPPPSGYSTNPPALGQPFAQSFPYGVPLADNEDTRALAAARQLLQEVTPAPQSARRDWHPVDTQHFLKDLCAPPDMRRVPILVGHSTPPLSDMGGVLADRLAAQVDRTGDAALLLRYRTVQYLSMQALLLLPATAGQPDPRRVLDQAKQWVSSLAAVLMVDHVELLRPNAPLRPPLQRLDEQLRTQLVTQLVTSGSALVFGVYHVANGTDIATGTREARQAFPDALVIPMTAYGPQNTKEFIRRAYLADWERQYTCTFADNAFDHVIGLAAGIWIDAEQLPLPGSVIEVAKDTLDMVARGDETIVQNALRALDAIRDLLAREVPAADAQVTDELRQRYRRLLQEADSEIRGLTRPQRFNMSQGKKVVTRPYVTAQLLSPNRSQFHMPGYGPDGPIRQP